MSAHRDSRFLGAALQRTALVAVAIAAWGLMPMHGRTVPDPAAWDRSLPDLELGYVEIAADSLEDCWQQVGEKFMLRSILYGANRTSASKPFSFKKNECTVRELYNAITGSYAEFTWSHDPKTGVSWIHPKDKTLKEFLSRPVKVKTDALSVPMFSGILNPLASQSADSIQVGKRGESFTNSFNYPVHLKKGAHSLRELLELCCLSHPKKTFSITEKPDSVIITPVSLTVSRTLFFPQGAVHWWGTQVDLNCRGAPSHAEIIEQLASSDPAKRTAARHFLDMMVMSLPFENWIREHRSEASALWISLGVLSFTVRDPGCNCILLDAIKTLQSAAARKAFLLKETPELALLVSMELARDVQRTDALEIVASRKLQRKDVAQIESDLHRLARTSKPLRDFISKHNPDWKGFSRKQVEGMNQPVVELGPDSKK